MDQERLGESYSNLWRSRLFPRNLHVVTAEGKTRNRFDKTFRAMVYTGHFVLGMVLPELSVDVTRALEEKPGDSDLEALDTEISSMTDAIKDIISVSETQRKTYLETMEVMESSVSFDQRRGKVRQNIDALVLLSIKRF